MPRPRRMPRRTAACRLDAYLAAGIQASSLIASTVDAEIIPVDIGPTGLNIGGVNAGLQPAAMRMLPFPTSDQYWLGVFNDYTNGYFSILGLGMGPVAGVAAAGGVANPQRFGFGEIIDATATFTSSFYEPMFRVQSPAQTAVAPDFGAGSYIGFRSSGGNFGWIEVTWDQVSAEFEILAAAYESLPGVGISAGSVPEPLVGTLAALALGAGAIARRRRRAGPASPPRAG